MFGNCEFRTESSGFKLWSDGPNFDTDLPQDVTGVTGQTAYLSCRVFERENKTISWIRHSDLHILTVGRYTYTADLRYQSIYNPTTDEWILQIKFLREQDRGMYECQVSSQPVRSFFVRLNIVDSLPAEKFGTLYNDAGLITGPRTSILSGKEVHVETGSTLNLTCLVENFKIKPHYLLWFFKNQTIDYTSPRGGISVVNSENEVPINDDIPVSQQTRHTGFKSTLLLHRVSDLDSGSYTCRPSNSDPVSVLVYIHQDTDKQQETIRSNSGSLIPLPLPLLSLILLLLLKF